FSVRVHRDSICCITFAFTRPRQTIFNFQTALLRVSVCNALLSGNRSGDHLPPLALEVVGDTGECGIVAGLVFIVGLPESPWSPILADRVSVFPLCQI
ncbi:MAG: hypothetical protein ACPIA2_17835, partial [Mariniblastus sp.]